MNYLGKTSLNRLYQVHPKLAACAVLAITDCEVDFTVSEGVRTSARQQYLVAMKKSWTMQSKHLVQDDGFAHAVDLVPIEDGKPAWDKCHLVNEAMQRAAKKLKVNLRWGGDWDMDGSSDGEHQRGTYDGPHFELV